MRTNGATSRRGAATASGPAGQRSASTHVSGGPALESSADIRIELEPWSDTIAVATLVVVLGILVFVLGLLG